MKTQKPFPWKCGNCGRRSVKPAMTPYSVDMEHDGRTYSVSIDGLEAPRCEECGEVVLDDHANRQISGAFRQQVGLLTPEQIRENRERLGKTQKELAATLGIAEATLSRWETGAQIQQRVMDRFLRLYFAIPSVRQTLADEKGMQALGALVQHEPEALAAEGMTEFREAAIAAFQQAISSLDSRMPEHAHGRIGDLWHARQPEIAQSLWPVFRWCISADSGTLHTWRSCFEQRLPMTPQCDSHATPKGRWFVFPLQVEGTADLERASRISRLADALERLPEEKEVAAIEGLLIIVGHDSLSNVSR